jgi:hypothetical protein
MAEVKFEPYPNYEYIGPTVARIGLKTRTLVLGNEPPPQLRSLIDLKPIVAVLFVPTNKVGQAIANKAKKGTIEHLASEEVIKYSREKVALERVVNQERIER